jgi:MFS transporter, DHA2 family, multidrug resistance protein
LIVVGIGCLQIVLDKGEREDWFSSNFIVRLSILAVICLVSFIFVELKGREPILNLREFKDRSFAAANIIQCSAFFVLFGSILLLPLFLQELMGYTSFLAGLALAPGGVATLFTMPLTGKLVTKVNPKAVLITGLVITAYSVFTMTQFNLNVDFFTVALSRFVMGIGMGMVFIPLTSMAFSTVKKEEMGNATSIYNLLRNIAGSVGIAFMTTFLARRAQFHQFRLSEKMNPYDLSFKLGMKGSAYTAATAKPGTSLGLIYQELLRQANLLSFTDAFWFATMIMLCIIPLVFLLRKPRHSAIAAPLH